MNTNKRQYNLDNRVSKAYQRYVREYKDIEAKQLAKGYTMESPMIQSEARFKGVYKAYKRTDSKINVVNTLIKEQTYAYDYRTARTFAKTIRSQNRKGKMTEYKDITMNDIRAGRFDVSYLNDALKEENPGWTGTQRQEWISQFVFGSD